MSGLIKALNANIFCSIFDDYSKKLNPPQLVAGLINGDTITELFSYGFEDGEVKKKPERTQFRIASMTKCFAAAMVLKLRDQGQLDLADTISNFIPDLRDGRWSQVSIFDLLTMRSGLPTDDPWGDRLLSYSNEELTAVYAEELIFASDYGKEFHYSNLGYMLLGRIISKVTGISALQAIQEQLLIPLGMHQTEWIPRGGDWLPGFTKLNSALIEQPVDHAVADGAVFAGLWSTINDLTIWLTFLMNSNQAKADCYQNILSLNSRRELQKGVVTVSPPKSSSALTEGFEYAFGLRVFTNRELNFIGHSGGLPGYGSHFRWHQDTKIGVVALTNLTYGDVTKPCQEALRIAVLNQRASGRPVLPIVKQRAEQLFMYFNQKILEKNTDLFALNFFKDNPWDSFCSDFEELLQKFSKSLWTDIMILPEPGLAARIVSQGEVICNFSLSPGEGGKIQEVVKIA